VITSTAVHVLAPRLSLPCHRPLLHLVLRLAAEGCTWLRTHRAPCKPMCMSLRVLSLRQAWVRQWQWLSSSSREGSCSDHVKLCMWHKIEAYLTALATTSAAHGTLPVRTPSSSSEAESAGLEVARVVWRPCTSPAGYVRGALTVRPQVAVPPLSVSRRLSPMTCDLASY